MTLKLNKKDLDLIVYDFDGVLTDNKVLVFDDGHEAVWCNRSDGLAISIIKKMGTEQIIMSTETNKVVAARGKKLKITVIQSVSDKKAALKKYCQRRKISLNRTVYIGNDLNDLDVMKSVGFPFAPQDAASQVKKIARLVFKKKGGEGVVREFLELLLES